MASRETLRREIQGNPCLTRPRGTANFVDRSMPHAKQTVYRGAVRLNRRGLAAAITGRVVG